MPPVQGLEIFAREDAKARRKKKQAEVREIACAVVGSGYKMLGCM